jgi:hypothetical protein
MSAAQDGPDVELELGALEDVAVGATALARSGGDGGVEATGLELRLEEGVDLGRLLTLGEGALDRGRLLRLVVTGRESLRGAVRRGL